jgi:hypothetical protein
MRATKQDTINRLDKAWQELNLAVEELEAREDPAATYYLTTALEGSMRAIVATRTKLKRLSW